jgi:allophanate hydrolase subunit 1
MNPSRTYTPRVCFSHHSLAALVLTTHLPQGAVGIAGVVAAIYPIESPGGYQLYGRTMPVWHTWSRGKGFTLKKPWLLQPFDQVMRNLCFVFAYQLTAASQLRFVPIHENEYENVSPSF